MSILMLNVIIILLLNTMQENNFLNCINECLAEFAESVCQYA